MISDRTTESRLWVFNFKLLLLYPVVGQTEHGIPVLRQAVHVVRHGRTYLTSNNSMMFNQVHKVYQPHPALKGFVNNIVIQKVTLNPSQPRPVFIMPPIQEQGIFFYPSDLVQLELPYSHKLIELPRSVVVARRVNRLNVVMGYNHLVVKVGFQPGGLFRLLGIPVSEFEADDKIYESVYFDIEVPLIIEQLYQAAYFEQMVAII